VENHLPLPELEDATRVVYMPGRDLSLLALEWRQQGLSADLPCAVVSRAAQPDQSVQYTTLDALGDTQSVLAPSLLIAGWAVKKISADAPSLTDPISAVV
jgi:siroheme synthase